MEIIKTGNGQEPIRQTAPAPTSVYHGKNRNKPGSKIPSVTQGTKASVPENQVTLGRLQGINEQANREALRIRGEQQNPEREEEPIRFIKNYPPYPSGDSERVKFLRNFNGLKREIEQMTIPPDSKWMGASSADSDPPQEGDPASTIQCSDSFFPDQKAVQGGPQISAQTATPASSEVEGEVPNEKLAVLGALAGKDLDLSIPGEEEALAKSTRARKQLAGTMNLNLIAGQSPLLVLAG